MSKFKIGDKVWIKPDDYPNALQGEVVGFQKGGPYLPIVEATTKNGVRFVSAFKLNSISLEKDLMTYKMIKVPVTYE